MLELSALKLCNFWWLLVVGGVMGHAETPSHLLWQPPLVLTDGRKLVVSRKGPFRVWGCSGQPEMLRTLCGLHWVDFEMYSYARNSKKATIRQEISVCRVVAPHVPLLCLFGCLCLFVLCRAFWGPAGKSFFLSFFVVSLESLKLK